MVNVNFQQKANFVSPNWYGIHKAMLEHFLLFHLPIYIFSAVSSHENFSVVVGNSEDKNTEPKKNIYNYVIKS